MNNESKSIWLLQSTICYWIPAQIVFVTIWIKLLLNFKGCPLRILLPPVVAPAFISIPAAVWNAWYIRCVITSFSFFFPSTTAFWRVPWICSKLQCVMDWVSPDVLPHWLHSDGGYRAPAPELWLRPLGKQLIHYGWHVQRGASTTRRTVTVRLSSFTAPPFSGARAVPGWSRRGNGCR